MVPAAAIGSLSILLAAGLSVLGLIEPVDQMVSRWVGQGSRMAFSKFLPNGVLWLAVVIFAFGLAFVILSAPGTWRRVVLWVTTLVLIAGWAPVLGLAAHAPEIGGTFIAALWSGVCALVYAGNHRMPCDDSFETEGKQSSNKIDEAR
jgi:hypothetical protein